MATSTPATQYESAKQNKGDVIPNGSDPTLYKINPDKSLTPNTSGFTTSTNQLTTSGK